MRSILLLWALSSFAGLALAPSVRAQTNAAPTDTAPTHAAPTNAAPTHAAPTNAAPTDAARAEARRVVAGATRAYNRGQFERAREEYQRAYELYPVSGLLFNLAQCERELGQHGRAVELFERYLRERPDAPNRELVLGLIAESRVALGPRAAVVSPESQRESAARAELDRARRELAEARERGAAQLEAQQARYAEAVAELERARLALEQSRSRELTAELTPLAGPPVYEEWWFWTILVGVAAAIGVGVGLGVHFGAPSLPAGSLGTIDAR